jgi:hypothetical protein
MSLISKNLKNVFLCDLLTQKEDGSIRINYGYNSGGYESNVYFVTKDGGALSINTVIAELALVDFSDEDDSQWYITGYDVNYENHDLYDDHTGELIPAAYEEETE